mmetsp:Transcript_48899/g.116240  ORF Transcript_48899/g.116240 Transcript_48899/m.116240 type:complete len:222 (+) Transcript_48899:95-760(+)
MAPWSRSVRSPRLIKAKSGGLQAALVQSGTVSDLLQQTALCPVSEWPRICLATAWHRLSRHSIHGQWSGDNGKKEAVQDFKQALLRALHAVPVAEFRSSELANIVSAAAAMECADTALFASATLELRRRAADLSHLDISTTMHALGRCSLRDSHAEFAEALCNAATAKVKQFSPQALAMTIFAMARLDIFHFHSSSMSAHTESAEKCVAALCACSSHGSSR